MFLRYGDVELELEHFEAFRQQAVYSPDGRDYLYPHVYISCMCVFNPAATTAVDEDDNGLPGAQSMGELLRAYLLTPRRVLEVKVPIAGTSGGNHNLVISPLYRPGATKG